VPAAEDEQAKFGSSNTSAAGAAKLFVNGRQC
jgi:hypothetical protein